MRTLKRMRAARIGAAAILVTLGISGGFAEAQTVDPVLAVPIGGVVDPFVADHVRRSIASAADDGYQAVLVEIDTPGGLDSSMREITRAIGGAEVPVVCYVTPSGGRAASAGAFILVSCPVAAMAPGTNVGAATPIGISGETLSAKVTNDAAAYMRGLAERAGHDPELAARFVTEALSISADEALAGGVIDLVSPTREALLDALDGRSVRLVDGATATLEVGAAAVEERGLASLVGFLHALVDPTIAFVFFWLGLLLIVLELLVPGHVFSGTVGTAMVLASFLSFGVLPVRLLGIVLLAASVVFFLLELKVPGLGVWSVAGLLSLVLGGWFLFDRAGGAGVSPFAIAPVAIVVALFFGFVVAKLLAMRRLPPAQGPEAVIGREGVVLGTGLNPGGVVRVAAEEWKAVASAEPIPGGTPIKVTALDGLVLTVEPLARALAPEHAPTGGAQPDRKGNP